MLRQIEVVFDTYKDNVIRTLVVPNQEVSEIELFGLRGKLQASHNLLTMLRNTLGYTVE